MSKLNSDSLTLLIQRMSKSEKRHFKLMASRHASGDGKFIRLFDHIASSGRNVSRSERESATGISNQQWPNQKAFLYNYLLHCLHVLNSSSSIELSLADLLSQSRILYDKCLYRDCLCLIDKAKKIAHHSDQFILLMELLHLEKSAISHTIASSHQEIVKASAFNSRDVVRRIETENRLQDLSIRLNTFYLQTGFIRHRNELARVKKIFRDNFLSYNEKKLDFAVRVHLLQSLTGYYFFVQDFRLGLSSAKRYVALFEDQPEKIFIHTEAYIRALNSLLVALNKFNALTEFESVHRRLIALKRDPKIVLTENINLNLFKAIYIHEINRHFMKGEFRSGTRIVGKLENELDRFIPLLDHHSVLLFYYKIACLYFGADQYKRSLHWLNRIIHAKDISVREDLHAFARILALICDWELGNERIAEAHVRSLYRFLMKKGDLTAYNKLILEFLRRLPGYLSRKKLQQLFIDLREKLIPLTKKKFEKRAFYYFDIITWLDSKITKMTMEEIVKSRVRNTKIY
ncbi:MAG: hypothetical protein HY064_07865 [Bacteroidetes bacterium]|nr:hypothetical protein [Bacteroidota bacterium]